MSISAYDKCKASSFHLGDLEDALDQIEESMENLGEMICLETEEERKDFYPSEIWAESSYFHIPQLSLNLIQCEVREKSEGYEGREKVLDGWLLFDVETREQLLSGTDSAAVLVYDYLYAVGREMIMEDVEELDCVFVPDNQGRYIKSVLEKRRGNTAGQQVADETRNWFRLVEEVRKDRRQSWKNLYKASLVLCGKKARFGTKAVESSAKSDMRKAAAVSGKGISEIAEEIVRRNLVNLEEIQRQNEEI